MKKLFVLLISILTLTSCSDDDNGIGQINIRLSNVSSFDFANITVNTTTGNVQYNDLNSGQKSMYKTFETAYRYAFIELEIDGQTYTIQPIDYVGETPLSNGNYIYELDANNSLEQYGKLSLVLVEE